MGRLENAYKRGLKRRIEERFPGCLVLKNDEQLVQGIPDMLVLFGPYYALLEVKSSRDAPMRPNQAYYITQVLDMDGIAFFIYPENEDEVLDEIQRAFES
jgi:hypothetical protein